MQNAQEMATRIKNLAKLRKMSISQLLVNCGLNKNLLYTMQVNGYYPRADAIVKIADCLDCSVDYLLGRTDTSKTIHLSDELVDTVLDIYSKQTYEFISAKEIIQKPRPTAKDYFVMAANFDKIKEIYKKAAEFDGSIMSEDEYSALFKHFSHFNLGFYDASGYTLTPENYEKFLKVYEVYKKSFVSK
ncbi:MAG: hypothetical protein LUC92_05530 [Clostridiales bacterium]|nr:hypothetical protein [Clostridiales bacterium]